ncbi:hypothetical protein H2248_006103 [Termitomyces sp. 'cryptogamus']|nr:hypothetical protein H2248_006103 [Termitomyces sp. 'cryptogamus']
MNEGWHRVDVVRDMRTSICLVRVNRRMFITSGSRLAAIETGTSSAYRGDTTIVHAFHAGITGAKYVLSSDDDTEQNGRFWEGSIDDKSPYWVISVHKATSPLARKQ